jgi:hypothetical protein
LRKIISTALITAMLFFSPSMIPARAVALITGCGTVPAVWLATDTAFAGAAPAPLTRPCPPAGHHTPVWPWVVIGCAGSIVLSALAANFWSHRELTAPEAWTCGLLYWVPMQYPPQPTNQHH